MQGLVQGTQLDQQNIDQPSIRKNELVTKDVPTSTHEYDDAIHVVFDRFHQGPVMSLCLMDGRRP